MIGRIGEVARTGNDRAGLREQFAPAGCELHALGHAFEQLQVELSFERPQLLAESRLGHAQRGGGFAHIADVGKPYEDIDLFERHHGQRH